MRSRIEDVCRRSGYAPSDHLHPKRTPGDHPMKATNTDPIIDELRAVRNQHAARCGYDVEAIFRDIRATQDASQSDFVSLPPRRILSAPGREYPASQDQLIPQTTRQPPERRTLTASKDEEATFGHYMIGVFDVLGQSRKLRAQTGMPLGDDQVERQRVVANLKDTAGVVIGFRGLFRNFFEAAAEPTGLADSPAGPQRAEMLAAINGQRDPALGSLRCHFRGSSVSSDATSCCPCR